MLIAFSGLKGSGKNTAAEVLVSEYGYTQIAFADALRESLLTLDPVVWADPDNIGDIVRLSDVVVKFGWDYCKNTYPEVRRLLQVMGTEVGRELLGDNVWVDILFNRYLDIGDLESRYVITDCRFPNEADFVDSLSGSVLWVDRPGVASDGHKSESTEMRMWRNWLIINDGTIEQLQEQVRVIMQAEGVEPIV